MKNLRKIAWSTTALAITLSLGACGKSEKNEGPAEKVGASMGKAIDQATEKAGEVVEKAGEAMKEAGEKTQEVAKDAVDKMKDSSKK